MLELLKFQYVFVSQADAFEEIFIEKNPEYFKGNELACVTELSVDNINRTGRRILGI